MSNAIIKIDALSKLYQLGSQPSAYGTLRESLTRGFLSRLRRDKVGHKELEPQYMWALKDVTLEIGQGVVGIVGANGAGKSTLLKILSRITAPTEGEIRIRGRVGSLLEVGTGFHPELTGRENIYLNAAIMGMKKREIDQKFDEIIEFAEIARFLDTPVKRYSSGMYVRLAFAVAAHLDFDILVVDEVLAVGDHVFQKKCLSKMGEISRGQGRTVVFVSHNLSAIRQLTQKCLWLEGGTCRMFGPTGGVVDAYVSKSFSFEHAGLLDLTGVPRGKSSLPQGAVFTTIRLVNADGETSAVFLEKESFRLEVSFRLLADMGALELLCWVKTLDGATIFSVLSGVCASSYRAGNYRSSFDIAPNYLRPGRYLVEIYILAGRATVEGQDMIPAAMNFEVQYRPELHADPRYLRDLGLGSVRFEYAWSEFHPVEVQAGEKAG